ncbi:hypothetical protein J3459_006259 [Metarhizium acridum]|nr:hypothetical protein J3459_006259 [Metarhizium acridum]
MRLSTAAAAFSALGLLTPVAVCQTVSYSATSELTFLTGTRTERPSIQTGPPTGPYQSYGSKITLTGANSSTTAVTSSGTMTTGANFTATATSAPTNTQPCNNHVEFCTRRYSNITNVGCHNSPFVRPGNSGSNQEVDVLTQLNDGVRFLQAQIQWPPNSSTPHFCHTSCDLLDAGPIYNWLGQVADWVDAHPYDVVTILLGNGNYSDPSLYVPFIERSGITKEAAMDRMYIMNHNLNVEFNVFGVQLLVPAVSLLNETNGFNGTGSVGLAANNCRSDWGRAPNVLNVDYYNYGSPKPCSVFAAAAAVNNVTYDYSKPCGQPSAASRIIVQSLWVSVAAIAVASLWCH